MDTYSIKNLKSLEDSATKLANNSTDLQQNANSIQWILDQINANWENPEGLDIATINRELPACINELNNVIIPIIKDYSETLFTLIAANNEIQKREVSNNTTI